MHKKQLFKIVSLLAVVPLLFPLPIFAEETSINEEVADEEIVIYFFDDRLCPVCRDAKEFVQSLVEEDYPQIDLKIFPITDTEKLQEIVEYYGVSDYRIMAPTIFIAGELFQFRDFTSRQKEIIISALEGEAVDDDCCLIKIPFTNIEIDISGWSLPFITVVLGSLDGFNVCSIGALILILSIIMVLDSRKKMFFFGSLFILTAVLIYGTLVFVWGRLFNSLIGHLEILRIIVGLASLGGAIYFSKEFWRFFKYGPTCQTSDSVLAKGATERLIKAFQTPGRGTLFLSISIIFFAGAITLVELPCSIGIPIAFTGILIEKGVSLSVYTFYILLYLFFYMFIELVIFTGAVLTKRIWFAGSRAITWVTFFGAAVLFYLAFYYLLT